MCASPLVVYVAVVQSELALNSADRVDQLAWPFIASADAGHGCCLAALFDLLPPARVVAEKAQFKLGLQAANRDNLSDI